VCRRDYYNADGGRRRRKGWLSEGLRTCRRKEEAKRVRDILILKAATPNATVHHDGIVYARAREREREREQQ